MTSLLIFECVVDDSTVAQIIKKCAILEDFRIEGSRPYAMFATEFFLDVFIRTGIVRPQLRTLGLLFPGPVRESTYRKLLTIYPGVKTCSMYLDLELRFFPIDTGQIMNYMVNFEQSHAKIKRVRLIVRDTHERMIARMPCIFQNWSGLKELQWHSTARISFDETTLAQLLSMIGNLEALDLDVPRFMFSSANRQAWRLPSIEYNLTHLRVSMTEGGVQKEGEEIILHILQRCRSLRYLDLRGQNKYTSGCEIMRCIFQKHVSSSCGFFPTFSVKILYVIFSIPTPDSIESVVCTLF